MEYTPKDLATVLRAISEIDPSHNKDVKEDLDEMYRLRTSLVYQALGIAAKLKYECGIAVDKEEKDGGDWPIVRIVLPGDNQISWHNAATTIKYDGHETKECYKRIEAYIKAQDIE